MPENRIRVMVFEPGREAHLEGIKNCTEAYESIVEGNIKTEKLDKTTTIIYNKDGKEQNLPPNRYVGQTIINGTFFIASKSENAGYATLSPHQMQYYYNRFGEPQEISDKEKRMDKEFGRATIGKDEFFVNNVYMRLREFDFEKITESYHTPDMAEAKEFLKMLYEEFAEAFGTDCVDDLVYGEDEFIHIPAIFKSDKTGDLCVGLAFVDLDSSGELFGASLAFSKGFYVDGYKYDDPDKEAEREAFGSYTDYWHVPIYTKDIHTNMGTAPEKVKEMINFAKENQEQTETMDINLM